MYKRTNLQAYICINIYIYEINTRCPLRSWYSTAIITIAHEQTLQNRRQLQYRHTYVHCVCLNTQLAIYDFKKVDINQANHKKHWAASRFGPRRGVVQSEKKVNLIESLATL